MSSNQGIAIGAEMFRFFLHRACDTTARNTAVNNTRNLFKKLKFKTFLRYLHNTVEEELYTTGPNAGFTFHFRCHFL